MEEIEVPTEHLHKVIEEETEKSMDNWIMKLALSSALIAVFAAVCALLAGHHANEAMINQLKANDQWSFYQAKGIKSAVIENKVDLIKAMGKEPKKDDIDKIKRYNHEQTEIQKTALADEKSGEEHLSRHNTLSKGVTLFQIAIAISAIAALTRRKWLWYGSLIISVVGLFFFITGLL
jgi:Domain of unknown function (DUF4337)